MATILLLIWLQFRYIPDYLYKFVCMGDVHVHINVQMHKMPTFICACMKGMVMYACIYVLVTYVCMHASMTICMRVFFADLLHAYVCKSDIYVCICVHIHE